ncbi:MAG: NAD-dependent epimerase/dehydratase family protein [Candidatus Marinimicrobia bacterium]|nr:NAD-dependent epimerase/dehydratase family protein [Candidatus Neomarinimicrobiota bacterium]MCF7850225.1 NAD-dependent epimerase/dehydratase family protein [Candidatus Neomarinimicrobiota bacterium]MCF7903733.1 NAD-dependent epimerase/dehydratase family protein [Candidatus Neomarinimicrobiota bacterium]
MKVLFIGGTGIISSACSQLALEQGIDLYHLNRGESCHLRPIEGVKTLKADIRNFKETHAILADHHFDVVVQWIGFLPDQVESDIEMFRDKTEQYVFISSASIYQTPPLRLPITEETPLENPYWEYSRNKIACENRLRKEYQKSGFPYTIIRPSHTYDKTLIPLQGGITTYMRIRQNLPVIVHGDGASIWTLTHHKDFAGGLVGVLGKKEAINEAFHITSDEWLSWSNIFRLMGTAMGVEPQMIHIPSEIIATYDKDMGSDLLGDKAHSMIFDNTKIKQLVPEFSADIPFEQGAQEIVSWYEAVPTRQMINARLNSLFERIIKDNPRAGK